MNVKSKLSRTFGTSFVSLEEGTRIGVCEIRIKVKKPSRGHEGPIGSPYLAA
jgi:hypothetical protein